MTDLELTKACAEAMGLNYPEEMNGKLYKETWIDAGWKCRTGKDPYDPLHDDAQAMALVKKFTMTIERELASRNSFGFEFGVTLFANSGKVFVVRNQHDLNRAIVECVAEMQSATNLKGDAL